MFYAHFVLTKKGPLARIWLAAHWDKKLTKAHVFETNIDSSVEAIMKPKVKLALRTSGHLLLGVVRIYSRKAKYLLADCNEAFVKIKMAFRPGVVDLPEENREANVAAITLQENFHDFDALEDLQDIDMTAQFSTVNQSRPEEITMKEDLTTISFVGDDNFGDVGFNEQELLRDANFDESYLKSPRPDISIQQIQDKSDNSLSAGAPTMDVDLPQLDDGFGGGFMDIDHNDDDDDDNDADNFGGGVDQEFLGEDLMAGGNLFEDTPAVPEVPVATPAPQQKEIPEPPQAAVPMDSMMTATPLPGPSGEQTTLITNENEAFALEPLDTTHITGGIERKKRKRKLIVDEQQGIPSETMKLQLSDTSDIVTTLDLAPPTKKLMHWKETGGFEKLFSLPGCAIRSKNVLRLYKRNLKTRPTEDLEVDEERLELEATEVMREEDRSVTEKSKVGMSTIRPDISTIMEESSILETSKRSRTSDHVAPEMPTPKTPRQSTSTIEPQNVSDIFGPSMMDSHIDLPEVPRLPFDEDGPPSIAPFSVGPHSVGPASCGPPSTGPVAFGDDVEGGDQMPENEEQEEKRWTKRTEQMQHTLDQGFRYTDELSFKDMARKLNRKQVTSKFYTLLVLKKHKVVTVNQTEPFGDILIGKGPKFGISC